MEEHPQRWRRRTCGLLAALHAGYIVLAVLLVVWGVTEASRQAEAGDAGAQMTIWLMLSFLIGPLLIGLLIVSPLFVWLTALAVGLWRGRRWARVGGIVTFGLAGVTLLAAGFASGVDQQSKIFFGLLMPAPSLICLALLLSGRGAFAPGRQAVGTSPAT